MVKNKEKLLILFILIFAFYLRIHFMMRGLFYDELSLVTHQIQAPSFLNALYGHFSTANHLGYTALIYPLCHLLGTNEWTVRIPALLFGLGSIFIFWRWSKEFFGSATALLGSLLLCLIPAHLIWSTSGRGYSASIFLTILSSWLYFSLLKKPSLKTALLLALTNVLGISFHLYLLFLVLSQGLHALINSIQYQSHSKFKIKTDTLLFPFISLAACALMTWLIFLPTLPVLLGMSSTHGSLVLDFPRTLLNDLLSLHTWPWGSLCLILALAGLVFSPKTLPHWRSYIILLFLTILPVWLTKPVYLYPRFFAFLLPFFILLLANGIISLVKISPKLVRPYLSVLFSLFIGFIIWSWSTQSAKIVEDFHYKFRDAMTFAESISSSQTHFCAFGPEDQFYQVYAKRPVTTFQTFDDFLQFYSEKKEILCFTILGPPMPDEHKKILLYILSVLHPKERDFDNVIVFDLKG